MLNIFLLSDVSTISLKTLTGLWFLPTALKTKIWVKIKQNMEQLATPPGKCWTKMRLLLFIILQIHLFFNHPTWRSFNQKHSSLKYSQTGVGTMNEKMGQNFDMVGSIQKVFIPIRLFLFLKHLYLESPEAYFFWTTRESVENSAVPSSYPSNKLYTCQYTDK